MVLCHAIRRTVFIEGQNVPESLEVDGEDPMCLQFLGFHDGEAVATARVKTGDGYFKFQRVAVLDAMRGRGVGDKLMRFMMDDLARLPDAQGKTFVLSSQVHALGFYERLGFVVSSDEYMEAGIAHRDMEMPVYRF